MRNARLIPLVLVVATLASCAQGPDVTAPGNSSLLRVSGSSSSAGKTGVCHVNGSGGFQLITVSDNALPGHLGHGDFVPGDGSFILPAGSTFSASNTWVDRGPPSNAFDGNTTTEWNAGGGPTQWIQVDFGSPQVITGLTASIDQVPDGFTNHDVTLDGVAAFSWTGNTVTGQTLSHTFASPQSVQVVRITTTDSPSWVAWVDILFTAPAGC